MNDLESTVSVLAVVALPLVGVGPMLLRTLRPVGYGVSVILCAAVVFALTRQAWATAFTVCLGIAMLLRRRAPAQRVYVEERSRPG